jgi:hypothetical protein
VTSVLDRVPVSRITTQAKQVHAGRTALTLIAGLFFVLGWVTFKTFAVLWLALVWCAVASREGWREAKRSKVSRGSARAG